MSSIRIESRNGLSSVYDYFDSNPRMYGTVRSLSISPASTEMNPQSLLEAVQVKLLSRLPNLQRYSLVQHSSESSDMQSHGISFHPITLIGIRLYLHVDELSLGPLTFRAPAELARLLIALPQLRVLVCTGLKFVDQRGIVDTATGMMRFRDKCRELCEVTIKETTDVLNVRLLTCMAFSALQVLRCNLDVSSNSSEDEYDALDLSELKALRVLEFMTSQDSGRAVAAKLGQIIRILVTLPHNALRELMITFTCLFRNMSYLVQAWGHEDVVE
ncbi:hypothetical protein L227DRAFT_608686 [Lentinus tigrinus ALCF2SS1-6]|uniref:Uncharacterized protein n=1 Tax=Lentinus tigrinus ALCF2SS1-6 TaxID=1328759 RepID=A0A5C2SHZ4_9APHY|nr:hypothetical protein L227DRAFT_608686 [Lentinus tigrinus ALCF2SS1-6]